MGRIFDLDLQLLHDAVFLAINIFILFTIMSYLLFNPVRDMLNKRREKIKNELEITEKNKTDAIALMGEYEAKLKNADKEAEGILSEARKKGIKREEEIISEAKIEAVKIIERAHAEVELEQKRALDDMKKEMIQIASLMASKVVAQNMNVQIRDALFEETLREMGEKTWQS